MKNRKSITIVLAVMTAIALGIFLCQNMLINIGRDITSKMLISSLKGYEVKSYLSCNIYYTKKDKENADLTAIMVSTYLPMLKKDFKIDVKKPTIIIYPNERELKHKLKYKRSVPMGAYYGGIIHILSPENYLEDKYSRSYDFIKKGPIVHELTHYFVDIKSKGKYKIWQTEGIALYFENKYLGYEWHKELEGKTDGVNQRQLEKEFYKIDESLAYRKSYELIRDKMKENRENIEKLLS